MAIIDEKGRLFNKINIVDFLIILFLFFLAPIFYFGYRIFHMKPANLSVQSVDVPRREFAETELNFIFKKVDPKTVGLVSVGDKEIDAHKEVLGEVLNLGEVMPYSYEVVVGSAKKIIVDSVLKDLPATLKIRTEVKQNNLYYKDRQITDNSSIDFVTDRYRLEAFYMPNLIESNNRVENVSDSIKMIQQKQKEVEYVVSKLQNKVDFLESKIGSVENRIASMAATVVPEETKNTGKNK